MEKNVKLINLTPHDINIVGEDGKVILTIPASSQPARVEMKRERVGVLNGIPVHSTSLGEVYNLLPKEDGVYYIVSRQVAEACRERSDLLIVDDAVRNEQGQIIGVKGFATLSANFLKE